MTTQPLIVATTYDNAGKVVDERWTWQTAKIQPLRKGATPMKVLYAPNMRYVYLAGNEFGETHYIVAESFEDAYEELLDDLANAGNICDHGGDMTDEERWRGYCNECRWCAESMTYGQARVCRAHDDHRFCDFTLCDCSVTDDGRWVNDLYVWMREVHLSVDQFMLVAESFKEGQ